MFKKVPFKEEDFCLKNGVRYFPVIFNEIRWKRLVHDPGPGNGVGEF